MNKEVKNKINGYKDEMISEIIKYVNMDTVWKPEECNEESPFGEGVTEGFKLLAEKAKADGFNTSNLKNMAMDISLGEKSDDYIGVVVPVNTELWTRGPFDGWSDDKFIYGRGSQDDKGPLVAAYYALKIIKELNIPLKREVRIIVGGNEETGHRGIVEYLKHNAAPKLAFTADSDFPLTNVEKGASHGITFVKLPENIISINGGTVINAVAPKANLKIKASEDIEKKFMQYTIDNHIEGIIEKENDYYDITVKGKTAHGSLPEKGVNAITHLLNFLESYDSNNLSKFVSNVFHDKLAGEGFGLTIDESKAKLVGQTSTSLGIIKTVNNEVELHHDIRFPSEFSPEEVVSKIKEQYRNYFDGVKFNYEKLAKPLYVPAESELASTLLNAYNFVTGENAKPQISGGGTYAKDVPNTLAFGMMFPDTESTMHAPDEKMPIRDLIVGTEIFVKAIVDLANK